MHYSSQIHYQKRIGVAVRPRACVMPFFSFLSFSFKNRVIKSHNIIQAYLGKARFHFMKWEKKVGKESNISRGKKLIS